MGDDPLSEWYYVGLMNNLPPQLPDVADPSDAEARSHIPGTQFRPQAFDNHRIDTRNTHFPTGTREADYRYDVPQLDSGYPVGYTPTSLELGYHNYRSTEDYIFQSAGMDVTGYDDFQVIPEPEPEMAMAGHAVQSQSADFQHMPSLTTSDWTTLAPISTYSQILGQSSPYDPEPAAEGHINGDTMAYAHYITDPTPMLNRRQFELVAKTLHINHDLANAISPFLNDKSTCDITMSKFTGEPSTLEPVSNNVEDYAQSNGPLSKVGPGSNTEGCTQEGQCVRCQVMKIKVCARSTSLYRHLSHS
jgi:hypothetical protein